MKDLSFVLPIVDRTWLGLVPKPSLTGDRVTRVQLNMYNSNGEPCLPWFSVHLGHVAWGVAATHPADFALMLFAARHSP